MNIKKLVIISVITMFLFSSIAVSPVLGVKAKDIMKVYKINKSDQDCLSPHDLIHINGNDDFTPENGVNGGSGTAEDPYLISNWNIRITLRDLFKERHGIDIRNTDAYFTIKNCFIHFLDGRLAFFICHKILDFYGSAGIYLHNVSNGRVEDCFVKGMDGSINIENNSHYNVVINCKCWRNYFGIGINRFSNNNTIENCTTRNYGCGVCLWDNTHYNTIRDCTCRNVGINIYKSSHNQVRGCMLLCCLLYPAMNIFDNAHNNTIEECTFYRNRLGLKIYKGSDNNLLYHNNFIKNIKQAYDECSNAWGNGPHGNYWSDYKKKYPSAKEIDGIWDTSYEIPGGDNKDMYPLVKQWPNPLSVTMLKNKKTEWWQINNW